MEIIYNSIQTALDSFDFSFCIAVNVLTYLIIKITDELNGDKTVSIWTKRGILFGSIVIVALIYYFAGSNLKLLINSSILAPVFWSWVFKPVCKVLNIDYKQFNIEK